MFLTAAALAKSKSKYILVRMKSAAETGYCFNVRRLRLQEKLVLLRYDPIGTWDLHRMKLFSEVVVVVPKFHYLLAATTDVLQQCVTKLEYFLKRNFEAEEAIQLLAKQRVLFTEKRKIRSL